MTSNNNEIEQEQCRRRMMLACFKENAENTMHEYKAIERHCLEIQSAYTEVHDKLDELLDQNKIPEYQVAFRQVDATAVETFACLIRIQRLKLQMYKNAINFLRFENPSGGGISADFWEMFLPFLNQE